MSKVLRVCSPAVGPLLSRQGLEQCSSLLVFIDSLCVCQAFFFLLHSQINEDLTDKPVCNATIKCLCYHSQKVRFVHAILELMN